MESDQFYNPNTKRWETRDVKRGKPSDTDYQDVSGLAAAAARAKRPMKPKDEETTDDQADALARRRKKREVVKDTGV